MTRDELLEIIDQAAREGWTELDLRDREIAELPSEIGRLTGLNKLAIGRKHKEWVRPGKRNPLTTVPPEIGQLTALQVLDLSHNRLTALPPEIGQLTALQVLDLSHNQLTALLPEIFQLTGLQSLFLNGNYFTAVPPAIGQLTGLQTLGLSSIGLKALPPEIGKLTSLQELDLSDNWLTAVPSEIGRLITLQRLDLSWNQLTTVPPEITQLTSLRWLNLGNNQLTVVPPEIGRLTSLTSLDLGNNWLTAAPTEISQQASLQPPDFIGNQLTAVPSEIGQLTSLQRLDLGDNQLIAIPSQIGQLSNLQWLDLRENQLTAVPPEIGQLTSLQRLDLSFNQLTAVPAEIGELSSLQQIYLISNQLTTVPKEVCQLSSLKELALNNNLLTVVPVEINWLSRLEKLFLDNNQLTALPPEIVQLPDLQVLALENNQLTTITPNIAQLTNLRILDLSGNHMTVLPPTLRHLKKLEKLYLYDNPLPIPPELLGDRLNPGNPQSILDAYFQASRPLREAKLLLVGEGSVGKTSLVERLLHNRPPSDKGKTVGVDIHRWEGGSEQLTVDSGQLAVGSEKFAGRDALESDQHPLRVNIWDFGGQEIYHATHQFFLTHRSLYLVVIEARKDEAANRLAYWLRHVQSFAGDAPIILVVNKSDQGRLALDAPGLMLQYPTIRAIVHTSCTTGAGIAELRQTIEEGLAALPHVNDWIPLTWFTVKEKLAALGKDFLPYESYVDLCEAEGISHEAAQQTLAQFLNDLGAALNFHDDRRLAGTHVLNPEWVTGGIYAILNESALQERGILRLDELDTILDRRRYPLHKHAFLLDIMGKFELAAPLAGGQHYLIPGLLPKVRPAFSWPADAPVALEYRYAILPPAVLSRLMVRLHHHTWQPERGQPVRWRNGLGVTRDGCRALIVADPEAARLTIALDGPAPHRRHLLAVIRAQLDELHATFAKLEAEEWVPVPGKPGAAILYRALFNLEARRIFTYYDPALDLELDVRALLDSIETAVEREELAIMRGLLDPLNRRFDKLSLQLSETERRILAGQEKLRHAILARLDAQETHVVGAILEKLDANQLELVDLLLDAADQQQIARWEAEDLTRLTQQAVLDLTRLRQNQPDVSQWQTILALLERDASWEQKVKLSLPLVPGILSFESEVKVDVLDALKEGWQRLTRRVRASGRS